MLIRVIDLYSIKPVDDQTLKEAAAATRAVVTVEDHYPEGGMGDAVRTALAATPTPVYSLAVSKKPKSGKPAGTPGLRGHLHERHHQEGEGAAAQVQIGGELRARANPVGANLVFAPNGHPDLSEGEYKIRPYVGGIICASAWRRTMAALS